MNVTKSKFKIESVLVVGEDEEWQKEMLVMLRRLGITEVHQVGSVNNTMKLLLTNIINPEVLIADFSMLEIDGFKLIKRMVDCQISGKLLIVGGWNLDVVVFASKIACDGALNFIGSIEKPIAFDLLRNRLAL